MSVSLTRGANTSLSRAVPGLARVLIGVAWTAPAGVDVDAQVILLAADGKVRSDADLRFVGQLGPAAQPPTSGGTRPGRSGDASDVDQVVVDLAAVPADVASIMISAAIYDAAARRQSFSLLQDARLRVVDAGTGTEIARHDLAPGTGTETAMVFGELYRHGGEWKVRAIGQGYSGGLAAVARDVGVRV